eukprot:g5396.t1
MNDFSQFDWIDGLLDIEDEKSDGSIDQKVCPKKKVIDTCAVEEDVVQGDDAAEKDNFDLRKVFKSCEKKRQLRLTLQNLHKLQEKCNYNMSSEDLEEIFFAIYRLYPEDGKKLFEIEMKSNTVYESNVKMQKKNENSLDTCSLLLPSALVGKNETFEIRTGFVFVCSQGTERECLEKCLFGLAKKEMEIIKHLSPSHQYLFLLNYDTDELIGVYEPISVPALDIDPHAWTDEKNLKTRGSMRRKDFKTSYPAQIKVRCVKKFSSLPKSTYLPIIRRKKYMPISEKQTMSLIRAYQNQKPAS